VVVSARQKEFELWSRRFIRELNACETLAEWGELIALNGENLGLCCDHNPSAYVTVKIAINEKQKEFPP
jgi:hypothetical protein